MGTTVAADELGDLLRDAAGLRRPTGPGHPDLYLSLIQPAHGFNAVSLLDQAYRQLPAGPTPTPRRHPATRSPARPRSRSRFGAIGRACGRDRCVLVLGFGAIAASLELGRASAVRTKT